MSDDLQRITDQTSQALHEIINFDATMWAAMIIAMGRKGLIDKSIFADTLRVMRAKFEQEEVTQPRVAGSPPRVDVLIADDILRLLGDTDIPPAPSKWRPIIVGGRDSHD